ncbi:MAG TPA: cytochrome c oxidase subunit II [Acetobacteraceae bacterium]|jgi:cytochrome c oxidase subunit 2
MTILRRLQAALLVLLLFPLALSGSTAALAQSSGGPNDVAAPTPWEMDMQPAWGPIKREIITLHDMVLVIITLITLFVGGLLGWVMWRYNAKRNPIPSRTTHHAFLEVAWTVIPVLILVVMAIPSFSLVYYEDRTFDPDLTIKVTAHQWYWEYAYPDKGNIDFSSYIVPDDQLKPGQLRLLTVDHDLVVPVHKNIRILLTSGDVIHSFFVPALGVQRYAIPGRTIETWMRISREGVIHGECNQICGTNHSRMPITIRAVSEKQFEAWLVQAKKEFSADAAPADDKTTPRLIAANTETQH